MSKRDEVLTITPPAAKAVQRAPQLLQNVVKKEMSKMIQNKV